MACAVYLILVTSLFITSARGRVEGENVKDIVTNTIEDTNYTLTIEIIPNPDTRPKLNATLTDNTSSESTQSSEENDIDNSIELNATITKDKENLNLSRLILSPYISEGRLEEARNASRVDPQYFLGVSSYSGYFTVNSTYNSNLFFWYFPVDGQPVNDTPWVIWLQGGPGASSMSGLFDEIGPIHIDANHNLRRNPNSWLRNHSLVFIDNPVGTGFSFTESEDGFITDMDTYGKHLYSAVSQLVQVFPELQTAPLFVAGESYAGKFVPALSINIHRNKNTTESKINFKGLIIGNPFVDPSAMTRITWPYYYFGLLTMEQLEYLKPIVNSFNADIAANRSVEAKFKWNNLVSLLLKLTNQKHGYNFLEDDVPLGRYVNFLRRPKVMEALHVGNFSFEFLNVTVNYKLAPEFLTSAKPLYEELLEHYDVLAYCGQLDLMMSCVLSGENYRTWRWSKSDQFLQALRYPYIYNNKLAGYYKSGGGLSEVVIRGAGHMAPLERPTQLRALVSRFTHRRPLAPSPHPLIYPDLAKFTVTRSDSNGTQHTL